MCARSVLRRSGSFEKAHAYSHERETVSNVMCAEKSLRRSVALKSAHAYSRERETVRM